MVKYFQDRADAGRQLAHCLTQYKDEDCVVMALPRGGVPVALEIARALSAPLELMMVRKIGAPGAPEFGIGAVADGVDPYVLLNPGVGQMNVSEDYVEAEVNSLLAEIGRRKEAYHQESEISSLEGKTVILTDDGIATGGTVRVALLALAARSPKRVVLAVPVAPPDLVADLRSKADEVICLFEPLPFLSVGRHYQVFDQVRDAEVIADLQEARSFASPDNRGT